MKKSIFIFLCMVCTWSAQAQTKAVTETGEEVILYDDGTWKYLNPDAVKNDSIPMNPNAFEKGKDATFLLKSSRINVGFYINPKKWSFRKAADNPDAEYELNTKNGELYAMVITEKIGIPLPTLKQIAFENGRVAAPDLQIVKEELRKVNGMEVLLLQMNGTMQGIKFSYYGYYYSNAEGTVQFITYTAQNLMDELKNESEALLNGLVEIEE